MDSLQVSAMTLRMRISNALVRLPGGVAGRLHVAFLRACGAKIGSRCWLRGVSVPRNAWGVEVADDVAIDNGVVLLVSGNGSQRKITIESGTYVNRFTIIDASVCISIGANCMIGPHCYITDHDHGTAGVGRYADQALVSEGVKIGCNVWIGAGTTILKGVTIGDAAVVGAGAVVTKNVMPRARVAGVPAREITAP